MSDFIEITYDCTACGGEGWLPSLPEGQSTCTADGCKDGKITEHKPRRTAVVNRTPEGRPTPREVRAYLPSNYRVVEDSRLLIAIEGYDRAGWTLDGYVIPRLASGLIFAEEVTSA